MTNLINYNMEAETLSSVNEMIAVLKDLHTREMVATRPSDRDRYLSHQTLAEKLAAETGFRMFIENPEDMRLNSGILFISYRSDDMTLLTYAGKLAYFEVGESDFSSTYTEQYDHVLGCPVIAYYYRLRPGYSVEQTPEHKNSLLFTDRDVRVVLAYLTRHIGELTVQVEEIEAAASIARKNYGEQINQTFRALGADISVITAWWGMTWKREWAPAMFVELIERAKTDKDNFALALTSNSGQDLVTLGWKCGTSVPRSQDVIKAIAKAICVLPATEAQYKAWKSKPKTWIFGE